MKRLILTALMLPLIGLGLLPGCELGPKTAPGPNLLEPVPTYTIVAEQYNRRVERLDRVWARMSMRITGTDKNGEKVDEQAEGHLQVVRPDKLALSITKVGETYFYLGSNEKVYWWLDLHADEHTALVGHHDKATPQLAAKFDVPVHPLDLLELLGVTPLPPGAAATTTWARDGRSLEVVLPGRWGRRRLWLDPKTWLPRRIELLDGQGKVVVGADLDSPQPVIVRCDAATPLLATQYNISLPATGTRIALRLYEPENRCDRQKMTPFDFEALLNAYGVARVEWIDKPVDKPTNKPPADKPLSKPPSKPVDKAAPAARPVK